MENSNNIYPQILDYKEVLEKLDKIQQKNIIKKEKPIGYTTYGLPILHYTVGNGKNHIVVSGTTHGCEIITTDFVLRVMEAIVNNDEKFEFLKENNHTIHFLPMINPEGYLIVTSAIREKILPNISSEKQQEFFEQYLKAYNEEDICVRSGIYNQEKKYQKLFEDIDYTCIPREYTKIREKIKELYEIYDIPKGTLQIWSSNAKGIDLNQNMPYNYKIQLIKDRKTEYGNLRYNNIKSTSPGPIGCPMEGTDFKYEPETNALQEFLFDLKHNKNINLCAYLNYHSSGGEVYFRPYENLEKIDNDEIMKNMHIEARYNEELAKIYSSITEYRLMGKVEIFKCFNDLLRMQIPGDILIELSPLEANPFSGYIKRSYKKDIEKNLQAFSILVKKLPEIYKNKKTHYYLPKQSKGEAHESIDKTNAQYKEI